MQKGGLVQIGVEVVLSPAEHLAEGAEIFVPALKNAADMLNINVKFGLLDKHKLYIL